MTIDLGHLERGRRDAPNGLLIAAARAGIFWERVWPAILPALSIPFAVLVISLFDLWRWGPVWLHGVALAAAAIGFFALLAREATSIKLPTRREAVARLEQDGALEHSPLQSLEDKPFNPTAEQEAFWRAHLEQSRKRAGQARFGGVRATADEKDPFALRYGAIGVLVVALVAAGPAWDDRIGAGLSPSARDHGNTLIADIWIEPPVYTGKAPVYLVQAGEPAKRETQINAPQNSTVIAQFNGRGRMQLLFATPDETREAPLDAKDGAARAALSLEESGLIRVRMNGRELRFPIGVLADAPPSVAFAQAPARTDDAQLAFTLELEDDYGIAKGALILRLDPEQQRALDAPDFDSATLDETRRIEIASIAGAPGQREIVVNLQEDPWAGLSVIARVAVEDGAGQTSATEEASVTLPERAFFNPLARAVVEQRRELSVAGSQWPRVGRSFDAMTFAPETFFVDTPTDYLMLRTAFWRVMRQDGEGFDDAIDEFWPLALQLEDKALAFAKQRLDAAAEALREALERGADDDEIARLVEALRQAKDDYLQALAQSGVRDQSDMSQNAQRLDQSDLDDMLDAIRDLSESGADNAARQMLSELENFLNNLRMTQGGGGGGGSGPSQGGAAGEAGELIGRQRELADETFESQRNPDANPDALADREGALGQDLESLIDELRDNPGADPNGQAARAMERARDDMQEAENALRAGDPNGAQSAMDEAIANMREGAEALAREQLRQARDASGNETQGAFDPLGRPIGNASNSDVTVPGDSDISRTRGVIRELRRRLGEPGRSEDEIDYLERLLERF
ncbi:MAG: DUF4175 family protein [Pseudomonadota bacterium]